MESSHCMVGKTWQQSFVKIFPNGEHSFNKFISIFWEVFLSIKLLLYYSPNMFDWVQVWRLWRPVQGLDVSFTEIIEGGAGFMTGGVVLHKDHWNFRSLQFRFNILLDHLNVLFR